MKRLNKGFTLIELLVALTIIAILLSIVITNLNQARARGRDARRIGDVKQLQQAIENYFENNGSYPSSISSLYPTYLISSPKDPSGSDYCYTGTATTYCIGVNFENVNSAISQLGPSSACNLGGPSIDIGGGGTDQGLNGSTGDGSEKSDEGNAKDEGKDATEDAGKGGEGDSSIGGSSDSGCVNNYRVGGP